MPDEPGATAHTFRAGLRGLTGDPAVPLAAIHRWLDDLGREYQQRRSLRPVLMLRAVLALDIGDRQAASAQLAAAMAAPGDDTADCPACESGDVGRWRAALGDDAGALEHWAPVLDSAQRCADEPHGVLARALLPLARAGRLDEARGAHLRGFPLVRGDLGRQAAVGRHIEFCALTGNEARGLEILTDHAAWLAEPGSESNAASGALSWLEFATGACVLLRRLDGLGHGNLPLGPGTVGGWLASCEQEIGFLCDRYDVRNGTTAFRERVAGRLAQPPLAGRLPLGAPSRLPVTAGPPPPSAAGDALGSLGTVDELVARARRLRDERHPHARQAWDQVAASDQDLPADVAAELARQRAGALAEKDPRAGHEALLAVAGQLAGLGDEARACEARAAAALAQAQAGDAAGAGPALDAAIADADAAFTRGAFTPRQYLIVRRARPLMAFQAVAAGPRPDPAALAGPAELAEAELAEAKRLGESRYEANYHDMMAQLAAWRGDPAQGRAHLEEARRLYLGAGEPWHAARAEGQLARVALAAGDAEAAEELAADALGHGGLLPPAQAAGLRSLLADTLGAQAGRETDLIEVALTAAAQWDGLSETDTVHQTFQAARAYGRLGRHAEAASLFAEVMPCVRVPYQPAVVALTFDQYGQALQATGRPWEAADQFRQAAEVYAELGDVPRRVRCLRLAARLDASVESMLAVLAELTQLEALAPDGAAGFLTDELTATRAELDELRPELNPPGPGQDAAEGSEAHDVRRGGQ
ncbi:MAG TPA: hypothetical protein VG268_12355 [Streptosporangiaceae bacterium]|nr:hypothetical protein [Streptosporangiaceae bacterium]